MRRAIILAALLCVALLEVAGCAEIDAPLRANGLPRRVGHEPCSPHWALILLAGALLVILPAIVWRGRLGYAAGVCAMVAGLCVCAWVEGRQAMGHWTVFSWSDKSPDEMIQSTHALWWGDGGISFQHQVLRMAYPGAVKGRGDCANPTFDWVRAGNRRYPFGGGPDLRQTPHQWPLTWGFQFAFHHDAFGFTDRTAAPLNWSVTVPIWFLLVLLSVVPLLWVRRTLRPWWRRRLGLCLRCGYDLRATDGRCPECGAATPRAPELLTRPTASLAASPEPVTRTKSKVTPIEALGAVAYLAALISLASFLRHAPPRYCRSSPLRRDRPRRHPPPRGTS